MASLTLAEGESLGPRYHVSVLEVFTFHSHISLTGQFDVPALQVTKL